MSISIEPITDISRWNHFVESCPAHTFLHSWQWGQVQLQMGEPVQYLGFYRHDQLIGVALVITTKARRGWHFLVPHGPLGRDEDTVRQLIPPLVNYLRRSADRRIVAIRIAPLLLATSQTEEFFTRHNFKPAPLHVHAEQTWVLDIDKPESSLLADMRKTTRQAIRKAEAQKITVSLVTDASALPNFWRLYEQTKQRHHFVPWSHEMLAVQLKIFAATNNIYTITATHQGQDVASAILIHFGNTVYYYHGASVKLPSSVPASQLLQWRAIQEARSRHANLYNFWGIAPDHRPDHPFAGITIFKKGFGGRALNYTHARDLPLSWRYWTLWSIDKYRQLKKGF